MILSIDPGNIESAYSLLDDNLKPIKFGKVPNEKLLEDLNMDRFHHDDNFSVNVIPHFAIEMVAHYGTGMPAGKEIFDTCVWIGRFWEQANFEHKKFIYRKEEAVNLCNSVKAKDKNIIQALVDRFAPGQKNYGKGTKKEPGWFYGFAADIWQSYAVGITYHDLYLKEE
ncbi:hypothetical protein [Desulfosporosinus sp. SB140]|uniref:hypothetical protein n=1 Tax=Desulfosporosinus paludis TaxID=3115649 RepID=UPI00388FCAF6